MKKEKIGVLGLTHLGCVLCASWAKLGFQTVGVDLEEGIVKNLQNHVPPIFEPGLEEEIQQGFKAKTLHFSTELSELSGSDFIFCGYDTEVDEQDRPDTSYLEARMHQLGPLLKDHAVLIVSSQIPVGGCRHFRQILQKYNPSLELVYSPENLQLGQAIHCYLRPERIILGVSHPQAEEKCTALFASITRHILVMSLESAEIVKHGINAFLATSIVFSNQLADVCEKYPEAVLKDVIHGIKSDVRIGSKAYLSPGIGFSGGTLGRDVVVLGQALKGDANLFDFVYLKNKERKKSILHKVKNLVGPLKNRTIGVLGITYKPGTSTLRRSIPLEIVKRLVEEGVNVQVFDPKADYTSMKTTPLFTKVCCIEKAAENADLLLLLTEWPEFKELDWIKVKSKMKTAIVFDTKNALDKKKLEEAGFVYQGIG